MHNVDEVLKIRAGSSFREKVKKWLDVEFENFMAFIMKSTVFWLVRPCSSETARRFEGIYRLNHHGEE